jgi:hypothetical protein
MAPITGSLDSELVALADWFEARLQWMGTQVGVLP